MSIFKRQHSKRAAIQVSHYKQSKSLYICSFIFRLFILINVVVDQEHLAQGRNALWLALQSHMHPHVLKHMHTYGQFTVMTPPINMFLMWEELGELWISKEKMYWHTAQQQ